MSRGDQVEPGAAGEGGVDLQDGDVEGEGGQAYPRLARAQLQLLGEPARQRTEAVRGLDQAPWSIRRCSAPLICPPTLHTVYDDRPQLTILCSWPAIGALYRRPWACQWTRW
jgi:hypothetical protein